MRIPVSLIVASVVAVLVFALWYVSRDSAPEGVAPVNTTGITFPVSEPANTGQQEAKINEAFANFLVTPEASHRWTTFSAADGKALPLNDFSRALDLQIQPDVERLINQYNWRLYQCGEGKTADASNHEVVLSLRFALQSNYAGDLYADQTRGLLAWERTMIDDVSPVVFPFDLYGEVTSKGEFVTAADEPQVTLRVSSVQFANGQTAELGYVFVGDELLVGNNRKCLLEAQEQLFDTGA